jgi:hypothetical protein
MMPNLPAGRSSLSDAYSGCERDRPGWVSPAGADRLAGDKDPRGVCSRARGILDTDLAGKNATFANPSILVGLIEWADKLLTE